MYHIRYAKMCIDNNYEGYGWIGMDVCTESNTVRTPQKYCRSYIIQHPKSVLQKYLSYLISKIRKIRVTEAINIVHIMGMQNMRETF